MEPDSLDALARRFAAGSRRGLLAALAALAASAVAAPEPARAAACLNRGKPCKRGGQCCSGLCAGKKGKKRCRASAGQSICRVADDICAQPADSPGVDCGIGPVDCSCFVTASGQAFCSDGQGTGVACDDDVDCVAGVGLGARCVEQRTGRCNNGPPVRSCQRRCPDPI